MGSQSGSTPSGITEHFGRHFKPKFAAYLILLFKHYHPSQYSKVDIIQCCQNLAEFLSSMTTRGSQCGSTLSGIIEHFGRNFRAKFPSHLMLQCPIHHPGQYSMLDTVKLSQKLAEILDKMKHVCFSKWRPQKLKIRRNIRVF